MTFADVQRAINGAWEKDWVRRPRAARMKDTFALYKGRCRMCDRTTETLIPIVLEAGECCAKRFVERGAKILHIKRTLFTPLTCGFCGRESKPRAPKPAKLYRLNLDVCETCMRKWDPDHRRQHKI